MTIPAVLALQDGSFFEGVSIGVIGKSTGEVVFNTAMTGYQEILTDSSYASQIITLTYPHIGNVGTNSEDAESDFIWASGLIIRDLPLFVHHWRNKKPLGLYLIEHNVVAIAGIDTRRLTRILRDKGAQSGCIIAGDSPDKIEALAKANAFPGLKGIDLVKQVSTKKIYQWKELSCNLYKESNELKLNMPLRVVVYDFGIKRNILRMLKARGCELTVVPAETPANVVFGLNPDGVFLSNGPGDPEPCWYAVEAIKAILKTELPVFGICLGHQLLALASGACTEKMKFGHHGSNHPVQNTITSEVMITTQNHSFTINQNSLPNNLRVTHKSLFDDSLQGIERTDKKAFGFQGHPEASPGSHDASPLFDRFIGYMFEYQKVLKRTE